MHVNIVSLVLTRTVQGLQDGVVMLAIMETVVVMNLDAAEDVTHRGREALVQVGAVEDGVQDVAGTTTTMMKKTEMAMTVNEAIGVSVDVDGTAVETTAMTGIAGPSSNPYL